MNKKTLTQQLKKVKAFENLLMRELTDKETEYLLNVGDEALLNMLGWTEEELTTFEKVKHLIMLYCTKDVESFEEYVDSNDLSLVYFVLRTICNELEAHQKCENPVADTTEENMVNNDGVETTEPADEDTEEVKQILQYFYKYLEPNKPESGTKSIEDYIKELKAGKELVLDTKTINDIEDYLWNHYDNVTIKVTNNKISAKF